MTAFIMAMVLSLAANEPPVTTGLAPSREAAAPASQPAIPGYDGKIRETIDRALQQYVLAKSYQDVSVSSLELELDGATAPPSESRKQTLAFVRPNKLVLSTPLFAIQSDGKTLREAVQLWFQYMETPAPKELRIKDISLSEFPFFEDNAHPLLSVLLRDGKSGMDFLGTVTRLDEIRAEPLDGQPGKRVVGVVQREGIHTDLVLELWFSDKTGLLGEIIYDCMEKPDAV